MKKTLFFDVETTGLDPRRNSIVQLSGILEIDGKVASEFNFTVAPCDGDPITEEALAVIGKTKDEILSYPPAGDIHRQLIQIFSSHIDKFDRRDKFYPAGYNIRFDLDFLSEFFRRCNDVYFGSWCNWRAIDVMQFAHWLSYTGQIDLENYKLETICKHYGIEIKAHDAMSDIQATRELLKRITSSTIL